MPMARAHQETHVQGTFQFQGILLAALLGQLATVRFARRLIVRISPFGGSTFGPFRVRVSWRRPIS
jgi:hypothetical protein